MMQRLEPFTLFRRDTANEEPNAFAEVVPSWIEAGEIRAAISDGTGGGANTMNDLVRKNTTHTAVTWDDVKVGERLRRPGETAQGTGYDVVHVIPGGRRRMTQLFLRREDWIDRGEPQP